MIGYGNDTSILASNPDGDGISATSSGAQSLHVSVGVSVGGSVTPAQTPLELHTSLYVLASPSSHVCPAAYKEHRPVEGSQLSGTVQLGDDEHPGVRQSPIRVSSRAKSPALSPFQPGSCDGRVRQDTTCLPPRNLTCT